MIEEDFVCSHSDLLAEVPMIALAPVPLNPLLPLLGTVSSDSPCSAAAFLAVVLRQTVRPLPSQYTERAERSELGRGKQSKMRFLAGKVGAF